MRQPLVLVDTSVQQPQLPPQGDHGQALLPSISGALEEGSCQVQPHLVIILCVQDEDWQGHSWQVLVTPGTDKIDCTRIHRLPEDRVTW